MIYRYSSQIKDDFIADILRIDESVYDSSVLGSDNSLRCRFNANRESFILAYDESEIIGYIAFFPITSSLSQKMISESKSFDDNIKADEILPSYNESEDFDIFLISVAVLPGYHGKGIGAELMNRCIDFILGKKRSGSRIRNLYSYAYTAGGEHVLKNAGFTEVKSIEDSVYSAIKFMQYNLNGLEGEEL